jgi:AcrR family transcriptional regulator
MSQINIIIEEKYYTKDPLSSELGRRIVEESILLLDELGFEQFTFKKLAVRIQSTEASIYRYFENKLKLLIYLTSCYWAWVDYMIDYETHYFKDPVDKLNRVWEILCHANLQSSLHMNMDVEVLRRIVISESDKTYLTRQVDEINKEGLFRGYKALCSRISKLILVINNDYPFALALTSTMMQAAHQQAFFALHLPSLTEIRSDNEIQLNRQVADFIKEIVNTTIANNR